MQRERTDRTADEARTEPPLIVDVDGSLVGGDLLIEGIARLLSVSPLSLFALLFWLVAATVSGRAGLKRRIAQAVPLPPDTLALNPAVLEEIAIAQAAGRSVWLASASDAHAVSPLAETVGATGCLASDGRTNLAGEAKAAALVARFGERGFDYIGNERRDLAVWKRARRTIGLDLDRLSAVEERADLVEGPYSVGLKHHDHLLMMPRSGPLQACLFRFPPGPSGGSRPAAPFEAPQGRRWSDRFRLGRRGPQVSLVGRRLPSMS